MEIVDIGGKQFTIFGKFKGANDNKFNRAAKLAHEFNKLNAKFSNMVIENVNNEAGRLALATLCLMHSGIRIGNEDSAEGYMTEGHPNQKDFQSQFVQTYGLSTLKKDHFIVHDNKIDILFLGKRYVDNSFTIKEPVIVEGIKALLRANKDDSAYLFGITAPLLNKFIKSQIGQHFSAKDFRTLRANIESWRFLNSVNPIFMNKANKAGQIRSLFQYVSKMLNNTPGCAKKNYVSPAILPYMDLIFS